MDKTFQVSIAGHTPLIVNRFHEDAQDEATYGVHTKKERPEPKEDARSRLYSNGNGPYVPSEWIRQSLIESAKRYKIGRRSATNDVAAAVYVYPFELPLEGDWHVDSRAVVIKAANNARVLRHRPMFDQWNVTFQIQIDTDTGVTERLMKEIVEGAGRLVGIGDFRPTHKGPYGRFKIVSWEPVE